MFGRDALVRLLGEVADNAPEALAPATARGLEVVGTDEADITLVGPDGAGRFVAASSLLLGEEAGNHVITARDVTVVRDGRPVRLAASPKTQAKLVQEGQTTSARVAYAPPLSP